jgi:hypothetical protein
MVLLGFLIYQVVLVLYILVPCLFCSFSFCSFASLPSYKHRRFILNYQVNLLTMDDDFQEVCESTSLHRINTKKTGADNIPQYVRRKNLKRMPTQRPNPK